ncbi:SDR family NAD(P)-dependent oxidoreductase [Halobacteriales archaeon Cl-PHB]
MRLSDKTALVTGAARGIGRAIARKLAAEGARVVVTDIEEEGGHETVSLVEDDGGTAEFRELDVTDYEAFEATVDGVVDDHGSLDVLVNNAGMNLIKLLDDTDVTERQTIVDLNVNGVWNGCRAALPVMKAQEDGSIINMSSTGGFQGSPGSATYSLTKGAVLNFTRALAGEGGPFGVRVNAICPGIVETEMSAGLVEDEPDPEAAWTEIAESIPLKRIGQPEDVAKCAAFLASDEAAFVTGHGLTVDGGQTAVVAQRV